jgi:D-glycero-D-manno-heptose 1,7-bisphosphate phosphatase
VFLDRDGVLDRVQIREGVAYPPASLAEVEILPGVAEATALLRAAGFVLLGITNQPDVSRGTQRRAVIEQINARLAAQLSLQAVYTCYHDDADRCACRKPKPGLILRAAADYNIDVRRSFMIGDRWSDIAAGQAAGCKTFLLRRSYSQCERCSADFEAEDLLDAAHRILSADQKIEGG